MVPHLRLVNTLQLRCMRIMVHTVEEHTHPLQRCTEPPRTECTVMTTGWVHMLHRRLHLLHLAKEFRFRLRITLFQRFWDEAELLSKK